jgi:hypothetical protein
MGFHAVVHAGRIRVGFGRGPVWISQAVFSEKEMKFRDVVGGTAALIAASAAGAAAFFPWEPLRDAVWTGGGIALALALPSFWSVAWAMRRSDRVFYSVFVGGVLARFGGLFATAYAAWRQTFAQPAAVLVSLAAGLSALSLIELLFIRRAVR